ncbi:chloride channel protein [Fulvivirga kasyanovii]|uniref:Chloride channel protein n=1 Tax=Fulvivirga kasyanovii TaxID=396812 RepID=A0ABW9RY17_9BACT|nr:chloride channel protein [Fulvivirga kasyanovii]MTI28791.1 chloride channel protein [Fulvivirga kasyanovii]
MLVKFLIWRVKHVSNKNFVLFLAGIIGLIAGSAAVTLKESVHFIQNQLISEFAIENGNYYYLGFPLIGILITVAISRFLLRENLGHGITQILYDIAKNSALIKRSKMFSRMVTSAITVGFGGSVGLEAPIVVTGSAIGSNVGRAMHLNYKKRTILIGCGAAGAISAIFNSPIAGVIFSMEVILADVTIAMFIPLLIASVTGALVSLSLLGDDVLFSFKLVDSFTASDTPYYILLGIFCGLVSVYFTRMTYKVEGLIAKVQNRFGRALVGGILLGFVIFLFPPMYGEGYNTIKLLLANRELEILNTSPFFAEIDNVYIVFGFIFGVILMKPIASALTIGSGGSGGIFAPSLFLGGVTGFMFATVLNVVTWGDADVSTSNFTLVGMCGVMSGVLYAPLTAIFLIAEITSGYELFVPLMLVSAISFSTSSFFEKHSLYTKHLIERGDLIQYDKDRQVLSQIELLKIIEKDLYTIQPEATLEQLVNLVKISKRNIFPVVNEKQELVGVVTLDDIRNIMFDKERQKGTLVKNYMHSPPAFISSHENMQSVMSKFEISGAWNLPVIDHGKYVGFLSKSRIFNTYRKKLIRHNRD